MKVFTGPILLVMLGLLCKDVLSTFHTRSKNPAVNDFTAEFTKLIENNKQVEEVLNVVDMDPAEGGKIFYKVVGSFFKHDHVPHAKSLAEKDKYIVDHTLGHITPDQYAKVLGFNFAESLGYRGLVTKDNALQLAAQAVDDIASFTKVFDVSSAEGKLYAILSGYEKFFSRFGLKMSDLAAEIVGDFKGELL